MLQLLDEPLDSLLLDTELTLEDEDRLDELDTLEAEDSEDIELDDTELDELHSPAINGATLPMPTSVQVPRISSARDTQS